MLYLIELLKETYVFGINFHSINGKNVFRYCDIKPDSLKLWHWINNLDIPQFVNKIIN